MTIDTPSQDDIYLQSTIVQTLRHRKSDNLPLRIAFLDIDRSMTKNPETQKITRKKLEDKGYCIVFVSSRPVELILTDNALKRSPLITRPQSQALIENHGKYEHRDLANIAEFDGLLDPDIVAGTTGLEIYVKQAHEEYVPDLTTEIKRMNFSPNEWRRQVMQILDQIDSTGEIFKLKKIEYLENYEEKKINVAPLDFRIQVTFENKDKRTRFLTSLKQIQKNTPIEYIDDSHPELDIYTLYLLPLFGYHAKAHAVDHIVKNISQALSLPLKDLQVLLVGDSFPDLCMGLESATGTNVTYLLPGGSPLTDLITNPKTNYFVDEDLSFWKKNLRYNTPGFYTYKDRAIIVGDIAYPKTQGPESVLQFLEKDHHD